MFKTSLLKHQQLAVRKLERLKVGALFMEMGTGKTRTYLELGMNKIMKEKAERLVILCPVSALYHTADEVRKHTHAGISVHTGCYSEPIRQVNIIGIESMSTSISALNKLSEMMKGAVCVLDESHMLKNLDAKRTKHILSVSGTASYRYISTGTPFGKGIEDLYSQFHFLSPLVLGYRNFREFKRNHLEYAGEHFGMGARGKIIDRFNTDIISSRSSPYCYEARKADCLDLPAKTYSYHTVEMTDEMWKAYQAAKLYILHGKQAFEASDVTIYRLFTALHLISSGIVPVFMRDFCLPLQNIKIPVLLEQAAAIPAAARAIVFCRYVADHDVATKALIKAGYSVYQIKGNIKPADRHKVINEFRRKGKFLVATTGTGKQSLDFSCAEYAFYISNSFDYLERAHSEDRIHRYGMVGNAHYIDILSNSGIEKKVKRSLDRKENAAKAFLDKIRHLRSLPDKKAREAINREIAEL